MSRKVFALRIDVDIATRIGGFNLRCAFTAPIKGTCAVFGKSGSGKTSLLRCMAGLDRKCKGRICIGNEIWQDEREAKFIPPHRRAVGYVFQNGVLFERLNVRENLQYGLKRISVSNRRITFDNAVSLLGLSSLLSRYPATLSGGEKQRVAFGQAVLTSPSLLLLDEPVSALDRNSKNEVLLFLEKIRDEFNLPIIYVSHSQDEVSRLADYLVVLEAGNVVMQGPMDLLSADPRSPLTREPEAGVTITGHVLSHDDQYSLTYLSCGWGRVAIAKLDVASGTMFRLNIKARDVTISLAPPVESSVLNSLPAVVTSVTDNGPAHALVCLKSADTPLIAHITRKSAQTLRLKSGGRVYANVKSVALVE
jgi:molybdate transport system ATP-binding protein